MSLRPLGSQYASGRTAPGVSAFLETGIEFADSAVDALARGRLRAFSENAFHAVELLARAELLSYVDVVPRIAEARRDRLVCGAYGPWAKLGNTDERFARLFNALDTGWSAITYLNGDDRRDLTIAQDQAATLADMVTWARRLSRATVPPT